MDVIDSYLDPRPRFFSNLQIYATSPKNHLGFPLECHFFDDVFFQSSIVLDLFEGELFAFYLHHQGIHSSSQGIYREDFGRLTI